MSQAISNLSFKYSLFKALTMFSTPFLALISLISGFKIVSLAFPSKVENIAGPCFSSVKSVKVCQISISYKQSS